MIKDHVLLPLATQLEEAKNEILEKVNQQVLEEIMRWIPDEWLSDPGIDDTTEERRGIYVKFLASKLEKLDLLTKEAQNAR